MPNHSPNTPEPRLSYLIGRIDRAVRRELDEVLSPADLNLAQYTAMSVLATRPGLSNAQLARRSMVTPQAMHQALGGLAERGLIERKPHPTRGRVLCVELTDEGFAVLDQLNAAVDDAEDRLMEPLDKTQRLHLLAALDALAGIRRR